MMGPNGFHKQAKELYARGLTPEQIAFRLNRSIESVSVTLYRAGIGDKDSLSFLSQAQRNRRIAGIERKIAHHRSQIAKLNAQITDLLEAGR